MDKATLVLEAAQRLLKVVEDIRSLADSIQAVCSLVIDSLPKETDEPKALPEKKPEQIPLEKVRGVLAENPCDQKSLRILSNLFYALKIHFHHHRVDHDPDENSDRNRNAGDLKLTERIRNSRDKVPNQYSYGHAEQYPHRKITLKCIYAFAFIAHNFASVSLIH